MYIEVVSLNVPVSMPYYTIMGWVLDDINLHNDVSKKWADGEQVEVIIMLADGICSLNREWNYLVICSL